MARISVDYRVNSKQGTQFRQWATRRLKYYLIQGYAINEKRLNQKQQEVQTLKDGIRILSRVIEENIPDGGLEWLTSLTLFVASSKPDEMETVKKLIVSVLNRNQ